MRNLQVEFAGYGEAIASSSRIPWGGDILDHAVTCRTAPIEDDSCPKQAGSDRRFSGIGVPRLLARSADDGPKPLIHCDLATRARQCSHATVRSNSIRVGRVHVRLQYQGAGHAQGCENRPARRRCIGRARHNGDRDHYRLSSASSHADAEIPDNIGHFFPPHRAPSLVLSDKAGSFALLEDHKICADKHVSEMSQVLVLCMSRGD